MTQPSGYSTVQIALHWIIAILIGINYFTGEAMAHAFDGIIEGTGSANLASSVHLYFGLAVLSLVVLRLIVRQMQGVPTTPTGTPALLRRLGELTHLVLYGLLIAVPMLGAFAWYRMNESVGDVHVLVMNGMIIIIGLHAVAALFHQFVLKDGLILRMVRPAPRI